MPPCILHRFRPFTAGDWHSVPLRVMAKHRGARASRSGCMGLFACFSISTAPGIDVLSKDGLTASVIDVNVAHGLFPAIGDAL